MPSYSSSIQSHVNAATNAHQASAIGINNNALPAGVTDVEAALVSLANQVGVDVASLAAKVGSSYYTTIVRSTASEYAALKAAGTLNANTLYVVPDAIVSDTFNRTVTDGLGVADTGQTWILENTATSFQVTGTQATLQVPSANNDRLARPGLSVQDATFSLRWSGDAVPTASANSTFPPDAPLEHDAVLPVEGRDPDDREHDRSVREGVDEHEQRRCRDRHCGYYGDRVRGEHEVLDEDAGRYHDPGGHVGAAWPGLGGRDRGADDVAH
jgi:hypothetical protein